MKKKLFENVSGNQFKLLTESFDAPEGTKLMREGLKKVFAAHKTAIPYKVLTNVGLGYIKSVTEAVKYALLEAQNLAPSFGFKDDEANQRFVKEDGERSDWDIGNSENGLSPMAGTRRTGGAESTREVEIGKEILEALQEPTSWGTSMDSMRQKIKILAMELIKISS